MRRLSIIAILLTAAAALAGCGVATQGTAQPLTPPGDVKLAPTQPTEVTDTGRTPEYLYFVDATVVKRVARHVTGVPTVQDVLHDLLAGPSDDESADGFTSALLGEQLVAGVAVRDGLATIALNAPMDQDGRNDVVLAYAQLVCTLTAVPQVTGVEFTSGGDPISVPRGDGSLSSGGPLTAADYTDLIEP